MGYYAFISYCHEDIRAVRRFHRKLEGYSIPALIRKQVNGCPRKLYPVFRDETDLSGVMLTPMIEEALAQSEFLIVICTSNSARSAWVKQEIDAFLKNHSAECIIPVFLDKRTKNAYTNGFPGMLARLDEVRDNNVSYYFGRRKRACFEIAAQIFGCCSPQLVQRYSSREDTVRILQASLCFVLAAVLFIEIAWLYKEDRTITKYCRDINFSYDWPEAVDPLNAITRLFADDYYICTYHKNRIIRAERISSDDAEAVGPGQFFLEADCMEFDYNSYWATKAQVSKVVFRDKNDQILFVKNFSLDHGIVDLTKTLNGSEPYFLPDDTTCGALSYETKDGETLSSCRIAQLYNDAGQISQIWYLSDTFSYQVCDQNGYFGIAFTYDDSGDPVSVQYLDLDGSVLKTYSY